MPVHLKKKEVSNFTEELQRKIAAIDQLTTSRYLPTCVWAILHYVYYCILTIILIVAMITTMTMDIVLSNTMNFLSVLIKPVTLTVRFLKCSFRLLRELPYMILYSFGHFIFGVICMNMVMFHVIYKTILLSGQIALDKILVRFGLPCVANILHSPAKSKSSVRKSEAEQETEAKSDLEEIKGTSVRLRKQGCLNENLEDHEEKMDPQKEHTE